MNRRAPGLVYNKRRGPQVATRGNRKKGFTLIEIMVAMIVLALLASGFFSILVSARYLMLRSAIRSSALETARQGIEGMKNLVRADTWWVAGNPLEATGVWSAWVPVAGTPGFSRRYRVDPVTNCACRQVTVQVQYNVPQI